MGKCEAGGKHWEIAVSLVARLSQSLFALTPQCLRMYPALHIYFRIKHMERKERSMKSKKGVSRRGFLKGAAAGAAAGAAGLVVPPLEAKAQQTAEVARASAQPPAPRLLARETGPVAADVDVQTAEYPGSDYMVDVLKSLNFEYIAA